MIVFVRLQRQKNVWSFYFDDWSSAAFYICIYYYSNSSTHRTSSICMYSQSTPTGVLENGVGRWFVMNRARQGSAHHHILIVVLCATKFFPTLEFFGWNPPQWCINTGPPSNISYRHLPNDGRCNISWLFGIKFYCPIEMIIEYNQTKYLTQDIQRGFFLEAVSIVV